VEICNVNQAQDPMGITAALEALRAEEEGPPAAVIRDPSPGSTGGGISIEDLLDDDFPAGLGTVPNDDEPDGTVRPRPTL